MKNCCKIKLLRKTVGDQKQQCRICKANHYVIACDLGVYMMKGN